MASVGCAPNMPVFRTRMQHTAIAAKSLVGWAVGRRTQMDETGLANLLEDWSAALPLYLHMRHNCG